MASILFHVFSPIHREILVARRCTRSRESAAKQGDGKSFSLVRREAKVYIPRCLSRAFSSPFLAFTRSNPSLASSRVLSLSLAFYLLALSLRFKLQSCSSFSRFLSFSASLPWFENRVAVARPMIRSKAKEHVFGTNDDTRNRWRVREKR